ncbi:hypothetical protein LWI29_005179 [Acer saccharum]|uniref:Protein kinase domain-containing protein n=1 Tax=Acer saccharum TaxID=4024 RepID=A0AA39RQM6_ACESA|nr:hypothetical protein LWI29_005179 [Acer saccharum]
MHVAQYPSPPDLTWYPDTGATHHMTSTAPSDSVPFTGNTSILLGNGASLPITNTGNIPVSLGSQIFSLNNVFHVPSLNKNLLSVARFTKDNSVSFTFTPSGYIISDLTSGAPLFQGPCKDGLYPFLQPQPSALAATVSHDPAPLATLELHHLNSPSHVELTVLQPSARPTPAHVPPPTSVSGPAPQQALPAVSDSSSAAPPAPLTLPGPDFAAAAPPDLEPSSVAPPTLPVELPSSTAPLPSSPPLHGHHMITRLRDGVRQPKVRTYGTVRYPISEAHASVLSQSLEPTSLEDLYLSDIPLNDVLPILIGNFNSLEILFLDYCNVKGSIPSEIGNLSNLTQLNLAFNEFSGSIPDAIGKLKNLQGLYLSDNELQGSIPTALCGIESLNEFMSDNNKLNGSLPECLDNLISLRYFSSSFNRLTSKIPSTMWSLKDILYIDLSSNFINRSLPIEIGNLKVVTVLNLPRNQLSGDLPISFRDLKNLQNLSLEDNRLQGAIPDSFGDLTSLELLDLSNNNLSVEIPNSLEDLSFLKNLNLSFNNLEGEIPGGGPFANFSAQSFIGNKALCGDPQLQVPPCKTNSHRKKPARLLIYILLGAAASTLLFLVIVFVLIRCRRRKQRVQSDDAEMSHPESWRRITYSELFQATDGFSESKLLGKGSFGSVYKGTLQDGGLVAVKVFLLVEWQLLRSLVVHLCTIPAEIGNLTMLNELYLGFNNFKGGIPQQIGDLVSLKLISKHPNRVYSFRDWELDRVEEA